jgi:hypothetical protein
VAKSFSKALDNIVYLNEPDFYISYEVMESLLHSFGALPSNAVMFILKVWFSCHCLVHDSLLQGDDLYAYRIYSFFGMQIFSRGAANFSGVQF